MANWQATLLNSVLTTGSVIVFARAQVDDAEVPRVQSGDTFYGSVPDGDPFGGTVMQVKGGHAIVEVDQKQHRMRKAQPHETRGDVAIDGPHETWVVD